MKKINQNVLAMNSNKTIAYICGRCGKEVAKDAVRCIYCNAKLGDIRCPFCNFLGDVEAFKDDTCPKCGRKNTLTDKSNGKKGYYVNNGKISKKSFISKNIFIILFTALLLIAIIALIAFMKYFELI
jgi:uncharacterized membrane protein YvbJ